MSTWREQAEDLATSIWTGRKATTEEVRKDIREAVGVVVKQDQEDATSGLLDSEVKAVLQELKPSMEEMGSSDLCHECMGLPGTCDDDCGRREPSPYEPPVTEQEMADLMEESLSGRLEELCGEGTEYGIRSFEDACVLTLNKGLVVKIGRHEFQITVVQSR